MTTSDADDLSGEDISGEDTFWGQLDEDSGSEADDWAGEELEAAYMRAMEVLEASDAELPPIPTPVDPEAEFVQAEVGKVSDSQSLSDVTQESSTAVEAASATLAAFPEAEIPAADRISPEELTAELTQLSNQATNRKPVAPKSGTVTPREILEALLFVGGEPLTTRKLIGVLRDEFTAEFIESQIDGLNAQYTREGRPYEIRLAEGGYRMTLREDFERIRRKTYGLGPKEVKLSQEAIEVLAVIAYHQPLTAAEIDQLGKPGSSGVVRQLLRRELVAVERNTGKSRDLTYRTTPRFLSLFGIRNLNELPRHEQVAYK
jgi:segregation and condensation protein B